MYPVLEARSQVRMTVTKFHLVLFSGNTNELVSVGMCTH